MIEHIPQATAHFWLQVSVAIVANIEGRGGGGGGGGGGDLIFLPVWSVYAAKSGPCSPVCSDLAQTASASAPADKRQEPVPPVRPVVCWKALRYKSLFFCRAKTGSVILGARTWQYVRPAGLGREEGGRGGGTAGFDGQTCSS